MNPLEIAALVSSALGLIITLLLISLFTRLVKASEKSAERLELVERHLKYLAGVHDAEALSRKEAALSQLMTDVMALREMR